MDDVSNKRGVPDGSPASGSPAPANRKTVVIVIATAAGAGVQSMLIPANDREYKFVQPPPVRPAGPSPASNRLFAKAASNKPN